MQKIEHDEDLLINVLTTSQNVTLAANQLGVSYTWLYVKARELEAEGKIIHRSNLPVYLPAHAVA